MILVAANRKTTPWAYLRDNLKLVGFALGFIALGAVGQAIHDGSAQLPWLHRQASELRATRTVVIPQLKALAKCEHNRAEANEMVAEEALVGAVPKAEDLGADCPHQSKL